MEMLPMQTHLEDINKYFNAAIATIASAITESTARTDGDVANAGLSRNITEQYRWIIAFKTQLLLQMLR
jgi:hypothetical protein